MLFADHVNYRAAIDHVNIYSGRNNYECIKDASHYRSSFGRPALDARDPSVFTFLRTDACDASIMHDTKVGILNRVPEPKASSTCN